MLRRQLRSQADRRSQKGFTLFEILMASAFALALMFGALYSTSESFEVVREGDRRVHTHIHARRSMDRILKDCRFADAITLTGNQQAGWTLVVETTGTLDPGEVTYTWNPNSQQLRVRDDSLDDLVISQLKQFQIITEMVDVPSGGQEIGRISFKWVLGVIAGYEAGLGAKDYTIAMGGSVWIRKYSPDF